jgi:hypothetical protein
MYGMHLVEFVCLHGQFMNILYCHNSNAILAPLAFAKIICVHKCCYVAFIS